MTASITVAVRVRPHSGESSCISIQDANIILSKVSHSSHVDCNNPTQPTVGSLGRHREIYSFDRCYSGNALSGNSQENVYRDIGQQVVSAGLDGFNACVFAYGQTSSGKTYTMFGDEGNGGLIPRIFQAISAKIDTSELNEYCLKVGYLEIYNEKIRDLLGWFPTNIKSVYEPPSLKLREHPLEGVFVQGLTLHEVQSYHEIEELITQGNQNRVIASTNMNEHSSRSHAILVAKITKTSAVGSSFVSKIHMVDLAGSERAKNTGATSKRLKEGISINQSLTSLGKTISLLVELSKLDPKKRQAFHIPYRNSSLTFLLKDSLGGNAKTYMVATVSALPKNFGETRNTLLYASRARKIVNKPVVNQDMNSKMIKDLQVEVESLKQLLIAAESMRVTPSHQEKDCVCSCAHSKVIESKLHDKEERLEKLRNEPDPEFLEVDEMSLASSPSKTSKIGPFEFGPPFISRIENYSDNLSTTMVFLKDGETKLGSSLEKVDYQITEPGISELHCSFFVEEDSVTLIRHENSSLSVNNDPVVSHVFITHGSTIHLSETCSFQFSFPSQLVSRLIRDNRSSSRGSLLSPRSVSSCSSGHNSRPTSQLFVEPGSPLDSGPYRRYSAAERPLLSPQIPESLERSASADLVEAGQQTESNCCDAEMELSTLQQIVMESCDTGMHQIIENHRVTSDEIDSQMEMIAHDNRKLAVIEDKLYAEIEEELSNLNSMRSELLREKECVENLVSLETLELEKMNCNKMRKLSMKLSPSTEEPQNSCPFEESIFYPLETNDECQPFQDSVVTNREAITDQLYSSMRIILDSQEKQNQKKFQMNASINRNQNRIAEIERKIAAIAEKRQWLCGYFDKLRNFFDTERATMRSFQREMEGFHHKTRDELERREENLWKSRLVLEKRFIKSCPTSPINSLVSPTYLCKSDENLNKSGYLGRTNEGNSSLSRSFRKRIIIPPANTYNLIRDKEKAKEYRSYLSSSGLICPSRDDSTVFLRTRDRSDSVFTTASLPSHLPSATVTPSGAVRVSVPRFRRRKSNYNYFHEYQIDVSLRNESWSVFQRFSALRDMHLVLKSKYPELRYLEFPPRKAFGNKLERVAADRRIQLQHYLQALVNLTMSRFSMSTTADLSLEQYPNLNPSGLPNENVLTKEALIRFLPFLDPNSIHAA